jgi:hypothetical protein
VRFPGSVRLRSWAHEVARLRIYLYLRRISLGGGIVAFLLVAGSLPNLVRAPSISIFGIFPPTETKAAIAVGVRAFRRGRSRLAASTIGGATSTCALVANSRALELGNHRIRRVHRDALRGQLGCSGLAGGLMDSPAGRTQVRACAVSDGHSGRQQQSISVLEIVGHAPRESPS